MLLSKRSRVKSPEGMNATISASLNLRINRQQRSVHRPFLDRQSFFLFPSRCPSGRLCEQKRTLAAFEHLYAFLAPQSAQIVHATMGEKKEKTFVRRSAAAVESDWLTQKSGKKKWVDTVP